MGFLQGGVAILLNTWLSLRVLMRTRTYMIPALCLGTQVPRQKSMTEHVKFENIYCHAGMAVTLGGSRTRVVIN